MSIIAGRSVFAQEVECVGKGDPCCRWVLQAQEEWESEFAKLDFYNEVPIVKEL